MLKWVRMKTHSTFSVTFKNDLEVLKTKFMIKYQPNISCISSVMLSSL